MSCNCNTTNESVTIDISSIIGRLTSTSGVAPAGTAISALGTSDYAYHHISKHSWLSSTSLDTGTGRTLKGIVDGMEFDYDFKIELKGTIADATLIIRKPFEFSVTLEIDLLTGKWTVKPGTLSGGADPTIQSATWTLGCGKGCIIKCLGLGALKCIGCGTDTNCWMDCLKDSSPSIAACIAKCCN